MIPVAFYVARARNGVIGRDNQIPWRIPGELKRFKSMTMGKPVIMGRKTWESLPNRPLPGRKNIVLTRDAAFTAEGAAVARTVEEALALASATAAEEIAIIGGAEIYALFLPVATRIYLTEIDADIAGDAVLPAFDPLVWHQTARETLRTEDGLGYSYVRLDRRAEP